MNLTLIDKIANTILYEGYNLYPYRPSAAKNQRRWTFGRVYPQGYSIAQQGAEPWLMQTQVLVRPAGSAAAPALSLKVRYLQVVNRTIGQLAEPLAQWPAADEPPFQRVAALRVGDTLHQSWQEGREQTVDVPALALDELLNRPYQQPFAFAAGRTVEPIAKTPAEIVGVIVREQQRQQGLIEVAAALAEERLYRITLTIKNVTPLASAGQLTEPQVIPYTFASTHAILAVENGDFVSLTDPRDPDFEAAAAGDNIGLWPVLVGEAGARNMMLAAPIILYDYPEVAPESHGDYFDGTEIDEMLALRVLTLTDDEKEQMAHVDEFARKILERTESSPEAYLMSLHGAWRDREKRSPAAANPWDVLGENTRLQTVSVAGAYFQIGDRVRLKPRGGADAFDLLLAGRTAIIEAIEQDFENNIHFAVVVDDDPGKDLGYLRQVGHRFFYAPDEVEPIDDSEDG